MNRRFAPFRIVAPLAGCWAIFSHPVNGADSPTNAPVAKLDLDDEVDHTGWFLRFGGRVTSGIKMTLVDRQPAPSIVPGQFDNGYVKPDVSGSSASTWNWGYTSSTQIQGNTLNLSRFDGTPRVGDLQYSGKSLYGGEAVIGFEFARFDFRKRDAKFGFELGYSYSELKTQLESTVSGTVTYTTAAYGIQGTPSQPYPSTYAGTFQGPGPLIGLSPTSSNPVTSPATSSIHSQLQGDFHNIRFGPWIELPWSSRFSTALSAGYVTIYGHGVLDLAESVSIADSGIPVIPSTVGRYSRTQFIPGAYAQLRLQWRLTQLVGVYVGGEFQYNTGMTITAPTRAARFDFGSTYGGVAGVSLNF